MKDKKSVRARVLTDTRAGTGGRRRVVLLAVILAAVALIVAGSAIALLARASFVQQSARLTEIVENRARVIEAIAAHEQRYGHIVASAAPGHGDPYHALLDQLSSIYSASPTASRTGEFVLGRREGDSIVILLRQRYSGSMEDEPLVPAAGLALPLRRALAGRSGSGVLPDYRGVRVLAAWEPVDAFGLGVVAKIDLAEVNAPFVRAGLTAVAVALLAVALGTVFFFRVTDPMLRGLRESEERFRGLAEATTDHVMLLDREFTIRYVNFASPGLTVEQLIGTPLPGWAPPGREREIHALLDAVVRTGAPAGYETDYPAPDGSTIHYESRVARLGTDGLVVVARDITERWRAGEERRRLLEQLDRRREWLEQLIYAASHDLRSPLVSVEGFAAELAVALDDLAAHVRGQELVPGSDATLARLLDKDIPEALHYINAGVGRMSSLLAGLLQVSRLGRAALTIETLDMDRLVADAAAAMEYQVKAAGAVIEWRDLPACRGDAAQIGQVLSNLIGNAIKYGTTDRPPRVTVSGRVEGDEARYCVEDNGPGIPPGLRERVFTLFYRADPAGEGDGLGLSIVRTALDRLGGRVWLESEEGRGSRFWFTLPAAGTA